MAEDLDNIHDFEAKETARTLPWGWVALAAGLILWGIYYFFAYSPAFSGWTQVKEYEESLKKGQPATTAQAPKKEAAPAKNPLAGNPGAIAEGKKIYGELCAACHGDKGEGGIGPAVKDKEFLYMAGDVPDSAYYAAVEKGIDAGATIEGRKGKGGMPGFGNSLDANKIWALVAYMRSLQDK